MLLAIRKLPVRNAHVNPCNSAEYQNKLLFTNLQTVHRNGLDDAWAACKAGYRIPGHSKSWTGYVATPQCGFTSCLGLIEEQNIYVATLLCGFKCYIALIKERDI